MLKKTLAIVAIHFFFFVTQGQNKLNVTLLKALHKGKDSTVTCLVKGQVEKIQRAMPDFAGRFNYAAKNIASVTLPLSHITAFASQPYVQRVELLRQKLQVLDDSALRKNKILQIHAGAAPLAQGYTGKGVLLGIIDTGTDIHHPDFKDSTGKTRIAYLWDQRYTAMPNSPQPYNYGMEWSGAQIDSGLCTHDDFVDMSHGTKVAGVAASNGKTAYMYRGVAPEAGIITVAIDFNNPGPTLTDAMNYIMSKASQLGQPVVINISLGDYFGSHDGKDLQAQLIDNMVGNQPGKAVIAAAGNSGQVPFHLGYAVSNTDTNFTWVANTTPAMEFQAYGDSLNFKYVNFSIGAHRPGSYSYVGNIGFHRIDSVLGIIHTDTLKVNGNRVGIISTSADYSDSLYTLDVSIAADSLNYLWTFETHGTGRIDAWDYDFVHDSLPNPTQLAAITSYKKPDTLQTICTSYQCGRNVISVGNYVDRTTYIDVTNSIASFDGTDNDMYVTSSFGPTRDGRIKPEIAASGENVATTGALPILTWLIQNYPFAVTKDSMHMTFGGSSAAAPEVAGFAALYFEKYPTATVSQLRQDIINCSYQDLFTTQSVPNNRWGYGKLDGFGALTCRPDITTSIKQNTYKSGIQLYPNPAADYLTVEGQGLTQAHILDISGREVGYSGIQNSTLKISLTGLMKGLYFITLINTQGQSNTVPFIKE